MRNHCKIRFNSCLLAVLFFVVLPAQAFANFTLEWDAVTQNTDGSPATISSYSLYRRLRTEATFNLLAAAIVTTQYQVIGTPAGIWEFCVTAVSTTGAESACSTPLSVTVDGPDPTATPTSTPQPTATRTPTPTATRTPTGTPQPTATRTPTPTATRTPTVTPTSVATSTPRPDPTGVPTVAPTAVPTVEPTAEPKPTKEPGRKKAPFRNLDADGDGRTDHFFSIKSTGALSQRVVYANDSQVGVVAFGPLNARAVPGNYAGDGIARFAAVFPQGASLTWEILFNPLKPPVQFQFGKKASRVVPGCADSTGRELPTIIAGQRVKASYNYLTATVERIRLRLFGQNPNVLDATCADFSGDGITNDLAVFYKANFVNKRTGKERTRFFIQIINPEGQTVARIPARRAAGIGAAVLTPGSTSAEPFYYVMRQRLGQTRIVAFVGPQRQRAVLDLQVLARTIGPAVLATKDGDQVLGLLIYTRDGAVFGVNNENFQLYPLLPAGTVQPDAVAVTNQSLTFGRARRR